MLKRSDVPWGKVVVRLSEFVVFFKSLSLTSLFPLSPTLSLYGRSAYYSNNNTSDLIPKLYFVLIELYLGSKIFVIFLSKTSPFKFLKTYMHTFSHSASKSYLIVFPKKKSFTHCSWFFRILFLHFWALKYSLYLI